MEYGQQHCGLPFVSYRNQQQNDIMNFDNFGIENFSPPLQNIDEVDVIHSYRPLLQVADCCIVILVPNTSYN